MPGDTALEIARSCKQHRHPRPVVSSVLKPERQFNGCNVQAAAAGPSRMAALTLTLGAHLLDLDRVPLSISALTLSHAFVPPEALVALVARHLAFQAKALPLHF